MADVDAKESRVIVFDNLVRPTDVIGEFQSVKAKVPAPFAAKNASACLADYDSYEEIAVAGAISARRLMAMLIR